MFGQTWDMHATATPYVILINGTPQDSPNFLAFTITGCVGMIGMNSEGIAVGINNLMSTDGQIGVTWPFVVRKILQQDNLESAMDCLTSAPLAGAHNYMLMDKHGDGYEVEAMSSHVHVEKLEADAIAHTNHCLVDRNLTVQRQRPPESQASSEKRLSRAYDLLQEESSPEDLMDITRDDEAICVRPKPPMNVESCGAAIMRPATGDFWAVWGLPAENDYEHFSI
jgi:isopenicillin-N N-acyltransferase-like protein